MRASLETGKLASSGSTVSFCALAERKQLLTIYVFHTSCELRCWFYVKFIYYFSYIHIYIYIYCIRFSTLPLIEVCHCEQGGCLNRGLLLLLLQSAFVGANCCFSLHLLVQTKSRQCQDGTEVIVTGQWLFFSLLKKTMTGTPCCQVMTFLRSSWRMPSALEKKPSR